MCVEVGHFLERQKFEDRARRAIIKLRESMEPTQASTKERISDLNDVVERLMAKEWGVPIQDPEALNDSQFMVSAPRTSELDDVVMIIYLAVDRGMNPAVWLEPDEDEMDGSQHSQRDGEHDFLVCKEFFDRMHSLKIVLRSWEFKTTQSVISGDVDDPDSGGLSKEDEELICDMFGVEGDSPDSTLPLIDVKSFLFHCYERMEDVELKFKAQQVEYEQALLDSSFDDAAIRTSMNELKQSRKARQQERDEEIERMNEFMEQQKRTGEILLSPDAIVTNTTLPHSPYDEEVAFDLDFEDEEDSQEGLNRLQRQKDIKHEDQVRKMEQLSNSKNKLGTSDSTRAVPGKRSMPTRGGKVQRKASQQVVDSKEVLGNQKNAGKTEDIPTWRRELHDILSDDEKAVQLDVVEDLLRKIVRQSNLFRAVEKRFGFVEPNGDADSHVGPVRTKLLSGFRPRLSEEDVREGFLAAHLVLTPAQVKLLFLLVVKHSKCRLRKCGFLPRSAQEAAKDRPQNGADISVSASVDLGDVSVSALRSKNMRASGPRPSSAPTSPTRTKPMSYSPSSITLNNAVTGSRGSIGALSSATSSRSHSQSRDSPGDSSVGSAVTLASAMNLRQSLQAAANTMPISSREKAVLRGKLSAAWLWDYLRLLRLTRKTVPTAAALEILREQFSSSSSSDTMRGKDSALGDVDNGPLKPRGSKMAAQSAISLINGGDAECDHDDSDDSDYVIEESEDENGQLPMPHALVRAIGGKFYYIPDAQLDNIVGKYARSAALHGDGAGEHRGVVVPQAYLEKEILMRVQRWVGNVDASNDFQHKLRTALRQHSKLYTTRQKSAAQSYEELRLQQQYVRQMLVDEKAEEFRSEERLEGSVTKELFWKYIAYCKESHFKNVCSFSAWLDWRHHNFSSTHKEVQTYRNQAGIRLKQSLNKVRCLRNDNEDAVNKDKRGNTLSDASNSGIANKEKATNAVAFGSATTISRFGTREHSNRVGQSHNSEILAAVSPSHLARIEHTNTNTNTNSVEHTNSIKGGKDANRFEAVLESAEEAKNRRQRHILWLRKKSKEREEKAVQQKLQLRKEAKDKRRRRKAADAEFRTWLKLRTYKKFAVKDPKTGAVVAIRDYPFNADNPSVRVLHKQEWQRFVQPKPKRTTEGNASIALDGYQNVDMMGKATTKERRKASVPKQRVTVRDKAKVKRAGTSAGILDVSMTSL